MSDDETLDISDGTIEAAAENATLDSAEELRSRARRLVELRAEKERTKAAADKAKAEFEAYQAEFFDELSRSPIEGSIKVDLGDDLGVVQLVPRETYFGRILNYDDVMEFVNKRGMGDEFTKTEPRMARIHELVREHIEQKKPLPPGLDFYAKRYFTVTFR